MLGVLLIDLKGKEIVFSVGIEIDGNGADINENDAEIDETTLLWSYQGLSLMEKNKTFAILIFLLSVFCVNQHHIFCNARPMRPNTFAAGTPFPLSVSGRWIVDGEGRRVKLTCVNWNSHLDVVVAEGLNLQPVDVLTKKIATMGFNCVRFTWPLYLATNDTLASLTVRESFKRFGLLESIAGFQVHNPSMIDLPLIEAFRAVVGSLGSNNVMVILDNHITKPGWCCNNDDGNGFFGDQYFDPKLWIKGLTQMATLFNGVTNVIGMSLRNELRGPKQNIPDWYRYMPQGAETVHKYNPNVLVILSGLNYDTDLSFLRERPVNLTFTGKTVFEAHRYSFTDGDAWNAANLNEFCGQMLNIVQNTSTFLLDQGHPLFFSEFGLDLRGGNDNDNRFFNCFLGMAADLDFDWALWTVTGNYYLRSGNVGVDEVYGVLDWDWAQPRNASFLDRISLIQSPLQGPESQETDKTNIIFHPATGLCIQKKSYFQPLMLGPCSEAESWDYSSVGTLKIDDTFFCLQAVGSGQLVNTGILCRGSSSKWLPLSDSKMHLAATLDEGCKMCLDVNSDNKIITSYCKCLSNDTTCDPTSQWFKVVKRATLSY